MIVPWVFIGLVCGVGIVWLVCWFVVVPRQERSDGLDAETQAFVAAMNRSVAAQKEADRAWARYADVIARKGR